MLLTDIAYKSALFMIFLMILGIVLVGIYTIFVFASQQHVVGWTTTILFLSVGFWGVFAILAVVIKYQSIIVDLILKNINIWLNL